MPEPVTSPVTGDVASSGDGAIPLVGAVVAGRVEAIRRVMSGRPYVSPSISQRMLQRMGGQASRERDDSSIDTLSDRELEIFERIGRGMTTQQIGEVLCLSPKTVQTYRQRIKEKLGLDSAAELSTEATRWVVERSPS